ncbi:pentapeptide repeat-containing protein [Nocardia beijingensis]|uniref:Pentapeptide repeat-containing protein n=1 Tax=Nocardia beijingensis TaxID=95162 RepID=A0ABW7WAP9_9NOCA
MSSVHGFPSGADFAGARVAGADFTGTDLTGSDFTAAKGLLATTTDAGARASSAA